MSSQLIESVSDIKYCLYINLESRKDRKEHIEEQLTSVGIQPKRFNAIKLKNGRIGCSMSHLKCLEIAKKNNWPYVMICEDDLLILNKDNFIVHLNNFFKQHGNTTDIWNVLLLAGNNLPPYLKIDETCIRVSHCQTTTGYIVKKSYYDTLIKNIRTGITNLMKHPNKHVLYAIDKYWIQLQKTHIWYMIAPVEAVQCEGYSDIEEKKTNYETIMKDLDKPSLIRNISNIYNTKNSILSNNIDINTTTNTNANTNINTDNIINNTNYNRPIQRRSTLRVYNYRNSRKNFNRFSMFKNTTRKLIFRR